jgi:hypothetical protein
MDETPRIKTVGKGSKGEIRKAVNEIALKVSTRANANYMFDRLPPTKAATGMAIAEERFREEYLLRSEPANDSAVALIVAGRLGLLLRRAELEAERERFLEMKDAPFQGK